MQKMSDFAVFANAEKFFFWEVVFGPGAATCKSRYLN